MLSGFLLERLKKKSILNANIFRKPSVDYGQKISLMVKRLQSVLNERGPILEEDD